ncbi:MAG: hypothetical protein WAT91_10365 [Saprospiraceae bacterium]
MKNKLNPASVMIKGFISAIVVFLGVQGGLAVVRLAKRSLILMIIKGKMY